MSRRRVGLSRGLRGMDRPGGADSVEPCRGQFYLGP